MHIPLTKTTAAQNEDALSYYRVRRLYFLTVVFETKKFIAVIIKDLARLFITV